MCGLLPNRPVNRLHSEQAHLDLETVACEAQRILMAIRSADDDSEMHVCRRSKARSELPTF